MSIKAYCVHEGQTILKPFEYEPAALTRDEVEIKVSYCGICHSDLSMLNNEWQMTRYPFVPGHEIVGTISQVGENVKNLRLGQKVGLGWFSKSCMHCDQCMTGNHNLCLENESTIVGRFGGFADKVRADKNWIIPLPEQICEANAGPMFCGGITVFNPIVQNNIKPTDRVAVVGIGGLGHLALQFLNAWGCEVTAFSSTPQKEDTARSFGAHHFVSSADDSVFKKLANSFDMILVTSNVKLNWDGYISMLRPKGKLHIVGAVPNLELTLFGLLMGQKSVSSSPLGSPAVMKMMLEFSVRHHIQPETEVFGMSMVNDAMEVLRTKKPSYRLVLKNDF